MSTSTHSYEENTGFIRLDGEDLSDGSVDIKSALAMLEGSQSTFEYFLRKDNSSLAKIKDINYPIQTRQGCWEIIVPFGLFATHKLIVKPLSDGLSEYAKQVGKSKAVSGIESKTMEESFKDSFEKLLVVIKIAQHLGVTENRRDLNIRLNGTEALLINRNGNVLSTSMDDIKIYQECPEKLLRQLASVVSDYRTLSIGYSKNNILTEVVIDSDTKEIFSPEEDSSEPILPELVDGQYVKLIGYVCRGNQRTNTIGFEYDGHVVTCEPQNKLVTGYLEQHYKVCEIEGVVSRTSRVDIESGRRDRPRITFEFLKTVEMMPQQTQLAA